MVQELASDWAMGIDSPGQGLMPILGYVIYYPS